MSAVVLDEADYADEYAVLGIRAAREHGVRRSGCVQHRDVVGAEMADLVRAA